MNYDDCSFMFFPNLPTEEAYTNMPFKDYQNMNDLFKALKNKEQTTTINIRGYIYYKKGYEAMPPKGTVELTYNPKWWESGAKSCVKGCCTKAPDGYIIGTVVKKPPYIPWVKTWQEFKNVADLEEQFREIKYKLGIDKIWLSEYGWFNVFINPKPLSV
jgi:hypothetical protein